MKQTNSEIPALLENLKTADDKQRAVIINKLSEDYNNMLPQLWSRAISQENPRAILSALRDILKKEKPRGIFKRVMGNAKGKLSVLLQDSDPKVRKNVCGIIGEMNDSYYLEALYNAYATETQMFVRPSYILAIGNCGDIADAEKLQKLLDALILKENECADKALQASNAKHINEEKLALSRVIEKLSPSPHHRFKGFKVPVPMILTSMNDHFQVTVKDLAQISIKGVLVNEGILILEKDLGRVYSCRTFYEVLYPLADCKNLELDYEEMVTAIMKADIVGFLNDCHRNPSSTPFSYRIELKATEESKERAEFVKNLSRRLDELSKGNLKNSPSAYEFELRIVENKNMQCSVFIKLSSFKDNRFKYREEVLASSINPVTAAINMKTLEKWLKPEARVIDPFCGTCTMLIERAKVKSFSSLTGVDIYKTAITAATINTTIADIKIELITQDILDYSPAELFDEMITNMPFESRVGAHNYYGDLYSDFVLKIPKLVKKGGMVFLCTVEKNLLKDCLIDNYELELIEELKLESGGLIPHVFVLKVK